MRKIPKKAIIPKPDPIVIKIDPTKLRGGITLPKVRYETIVTVEEDNVYDGMMLSIPRVLVYYLKHKELLIVSTILEETYENGECSLTVQEISKRLKISTPTISNCLYRLRKSGLLQESPDGKRGAGKKRKLNYTAIQHLNDLVEGEDPGIYVRISKATRKCDILSITKEDIQQAYDNHVLRPDHDPAEEEEYD